VLGHKIKILLERGKKCSTSRLLDHQSGHWWQKALFGLEYTTEAGTDNWRNKHMY